MTVNDAQSEHIALLARSPVLGQVKHRLAEKIGTKQALHCYRVLLQNTLEAITQFPTTIWYEGDVEIWDQIAPEQELKIQPQGDLGHRMFTALNDGAQLVIGADVPLLNAAYIESALDQLASGHDVVIGPTEDGGYCLIGMNEPREYLFENIPWGSDRVLEQTLSRAQDLGVNVTLLAALWDVDTVVDYQRWVIQFPNS